MSNATPAHDDHASHEGPIKTPKQLVWAVFFAFAIPIAIIVLLTNYVNSAGKTGAGSDALGEMAVAERIQPVGRISIKEALPAGVLRSGEDVYKAVCSACHAAGTVGAPKFQDAAAWAARLGQGYDGLLNSALKGKGAMAPQGGGEYNDTEIGRAVVFMANAAGGKFDEPKAPAAAASAAK
jgi:cytochrome c5